jgi:hypothetical protein
LPSTTYLDFASVHHTSTSCRYDPCLDSASAHPWTRMALALPARQVRRFGSFVAALTLLSGINRSCAAERRPTIMNENNFSTRTPHRPRKTPPPTGPPPRRTSRKRPRSSSPAGPPPLRRRRDEDGVPALARRSHEPTGPPPLKRLPSRMPKGPARGNSSGGAENRSSAHPARTAAKQPVPPSNTNTLQVLMMAWLSVSRHF